MTERGSGLRTIQAARDRRDTRFQAVVRAWHTTYCSHSRAISATDAPRATKGLQVWWKRQKGSHPLDPTIHRPTEPASTYVCHACVSSGEPSRFPWKAVASSTRSSRIACPAGETTRPSHASVARIGGRGCGRVGPAFPPHRPPAPLQGPASRGLRVHFTRIIAVVRRGPASWLQVHATQLIPHVCRNSVGMLKATR
jgi:hypothetical protein